MNSEQIKIKMEFTFDEFVQFAKDTTHEPHWNILFFGHFLTHENDQCYLIALRYGVVKFEPGDTLVADPVRGVYVIKSGDLS